jgi:hypothetical protein
MKRDLRKYARQTTFQLVAGALILIFVVGEVLIYVFYGPGAAMTGLLCMGAGLLPVVLIIVILQIIDWIVRRANPED